MNEAGGGRAGLRRFFVERLRGAALAADNAQRALVVAEAITWEDRSRLDAAILALLDCAEELGAKDVPKGRRH